YWDRVHWGHAVSDDLVRWEQWPIAITPEADGPDSFGCWSGCVVDADGTPTMLYTGIELVDGVRCASICLATSHDGLRTWTKRRPAVIEGVPSGFAPDAFRDPFVWRDADGWVMLVGAGSDTGAGAVLLFRSADLRAWGFIGPFLTSADLPDTVDAGGPCWECPQLLRYGDDAVLILSITNPAPEARPSHVIAISGRLDGDGFVPDRVERLDAGPGFYAPASVVAPDGRHLLLGWIPEDPPEPGDPRDWAGSMTLPREIVRRPDGALAIAPARELARVRGAAIRHELVRIGADDESWLRQPVADRFELLASIVPDGATAVGIEVRDGDEPDPEFAIVLRPRERQVSVTRRGTVVVGGPDEHNVMVLPSDAPIALDLHLIVDGSAMEVFVDGRVSATFRLPSIHRGPRRVVVWSKGATSLVRHLAVWALDATASGPRAADTTG
ncbi:MAG: glycoside hydrolase family 32 protein, partial [Candidatus Limnocylindrales bacterium]